MDVTGTCGYHKIEACEACKALNLALVAERNAQSRAAEGKDAAGLNAMVEKLLTKAVELEKAL
jgi:hypothetical protein